MSTKIFVLKLQSPKLPAPPNDYILVLNEHLTPDEFVADLQELYPAIPTANGKLRLVLDGSYRMSPRQFLRYMMTTVAYTPEVKGGVCVPKLLGRGNDITIDYEEGLEPAQPTASRQSTVPGNVPSAANMGKLSKEVAAMKIGENPPTLPRSPPTHENANHTILIKFNQDDSMSPRINFPVISIENVPQSGGSQEILWLKSEILARLPEWLDHSAVKLKFPQNLHGSPDVTWNKDSFKWYESNKYWMFVITMQISW
ncbi:hypothetical protein BGX38DRAFT_1270192 [Terfezia claveryi]|nr:hypothetical protein BGX38DRAFT_1270192 [Terfezia claveryi]